MLIASICNSSATLGVIRIILLLVKIICTAVPIILIMALMIAIVKEILNGKPEILSLIGATAVKKVIAAILIFFIPTFINIITNLMSDNSDIRYCIDNATFEGIDLARGREMEIYMESAVNNLSRGDLAKAKSMLEKLRDDNIKTQYSYKIYELEQYFEVADLVSIAENKRTKETYYAAEAALEKLPDGENKNKLLERLEKVEIWIEYDSNESGEVHTNSHTGIKYKIYNQGDSRWGHYKFSGGSTMESIGCMVTSAAVVSSSYDASITPVTVFNGQHRHSYPGTSVPSLTSSNYKLVSSAGYEGGGALSCASTIKNNLKKGNVVIIRVFGPHSLTTSAHYVALIDYNVSGDKVYVGNSKTTGNNQNAGWYPASDILYNIQYYAIFEPSSTLKNKYN